MRVIFVGLNPSNKPVTKNSAWKRFMDWAKQLDEAGLLRYFSFTNLHYDPEWDGQDLPGFRRNALANQVKGYDLVVSLGNKAHEELNSMGIDNYKLPHPSPRNRLWNNKKKEQEVIEELKSHIRQKLNTRNK